MVFARLRTWGGGGNGFVKIVQFFLGMILKTLLDTPHIAGIMFWQSYLTAVQSKKVIFLFCQDIVNATWCAATRKVLSS